VGRGFAWLLGRQDDIPYFLAYLTLNAGVLFGSVWLFDRLLTGVGVSLGLIAPLAVFLLANIVTKFFAWTPHQRLFTIFTPLFVVWLAHRLLVRRARYAGWVLGSLVCGTLVLAYGNFALAAPVLLVASAAHLGRQNLRRLGLWWAGLIGVFLLPTVLWITLVQRVAGSYFSAEIELYRQGVWLWDAWQEGIFLRAVAAHFTAFLGTFGTIHIWPFLAGAGVVGWMVPWRHPLAWLTAITFLTTAGLLAVLGIVHPNLTYALVPLLLVVIGWGSHQWSARSSLRRRGLIGLLAGVAFFWTLWLVAATGVMYHWPQAMCAGSDAAQPIRCR
jgi:hypothetical protein